MKLNCFFFAMVYSALFKALFEALNLSKESVAMLTIVDFLYHIKYKYFIKAAIVDNSLQLRISAKPFNLPSQYKTCFPLFQLS
jgi:hypothetical protein